MQDIMHNWGERQTVNCFTSDIGFKKANNDYPTFHFSATFIGDD